MARTFDNGETSVVLRFSLKSTSDGQGMTGLSFSSSGLVISTIADVESAPVSYTASGSTIENISALGTYAAPTATKCRFKEVDSTYQPGLYEFHFANARYAVTNARQLVVTVSGATNLLQQSYEIQFAPTVKLASSGLNAVVVTEPSAVPAFSTATIVEAMAWILALARNKLTETATTQTLRNNADSSNIATASQSDDGTTHTRGKWT